MDDDALNTTNSAALIAGAGLLRQAEPLERPADELVAAAPPAVLVVASPRAWFDAHMKNSPVATATAAFNHLSAELGALEGGLVDAWRDLEAAGADADAGAVGLASAVRFWFADRIHGSAVARAPEAFAHAEAALERLEADLAAAWRGRAAG